MRASSCCSGSFPSSHCILRDSFLGAHPRVQRASLRLAAANASQPVGDGSGPGRPLIPFVDKMLRLSFSLSPWTSRAGRITLDTFAEGDRVSSSCDRRQQGVIIVEDYLYSPPNRIRRSGSCSATEWTTSWPAREDHMTDPHITTHEPVGVRCASGQDATSAVLQRRCPACRCRRGAGPRSSTRWRVPGRRELSEAPTASRFPRRHPDIYRRCGRSPRSGTPRPSSRCRLTCSPLCCARSAPPPSRPRADPSPLFACRRSPP